MQSDEQKAQALQDRLEENREAVAGELQRSRSTVAVGAIDPRQELVPCRDCRTSVKATVLYRREPDVDGEERWGRSCPPVMCPKCHESDRKTQAAFGEIAPEETDPVEWLAKLGVNTAKHGRSTIDNFDPKDAPQAPYECWRFVDDVVTARRHDYVQGIYLVSQDTGTGKSHLAVGIMRAVHEARPDLSVMYEPADRLITRIQDSYGSGTTDDLIEARKRAGLYVLDDLGREKGTTDALRALCTVLDEREGRPTVITSNDVPSQLGARHTDEAQWARVASRLGDQVYRYVAVDGEDRRFSRPGNPQGDRRSA